MNYGGLLAVMCMWASVAVVSFEAPGETWAVAMAAAFATFAVWAYD